MTVRRATPVSAILLLSAAVIATLAAARPVRRGVDSMFVWGPASAMTDGQVDDHGPDRDARIELLEFCTAPGTGVGRLYFLVDPDRIDRDSIRSFLRDASVRGVSVYALTPGELQRRWIAPVRKHGHADREAVVLWVRHVLELHEQAGGAGFSGIQLDIEPHSARPPGRRRRVWQSNRGGLRDSRRNREIAGEFVVLLETIRSALDVHAPQLILAATIPTWFDRDDDVESYVLEHGGSNKTLMHHVFDRVDFVTLMNYRDGADADGLRSLEEDVAGEIAYGPSEILFETARPGGRNGPSRADTLYRGGERRYRKVRARMYDLYGSNPNFVGCGVHQYGDAYGSGRRGWPRRP